MSLRKQSPVATIDYPERDGKPMGETDLHRDLIIELIRELKNFYESEPEVYVKGDLLLYYVEGDKNKFVVPDVFVVRGAGNHQRRTYLLWEERLAPDVVIEVSSRATWREDLNKKKDLYERMGVKEYYIFDPEYGYKTRPLMGYRLKDSVYIELEVVDGRVGCEELGLELVDTGKTLRLFDGRTGEFLPTEAEARRRAEEIRLQIERSRRDEAEARRKAEAEITRLREELERLRRLASPESESE